MKRGRTNTKRIMPMRSILKKESSIIEEDNKENHEDQNELTVGVNKKSDSAASAAAAAARKHSPSSVSLCSTVASMYGDVCEEMEEEEEEDGSRPHAASVHFRPQQIEYTFDDDHLLSVSLGRTADYDGAPNEKKAEKLQRQTATKAVTRGIYAF
ncbi:hypothetical protein FOL47_000470 [Perkinsus chesapeaki]|uniref:Uncharacterized protein n=1 Tax=Perkinsus chesapeaki TaxID=330153 RepID=A0A7J6MND0_PERCH|nr:hypothetical protein FOL47_000470 [Perkinsus chesapeaki]